MDLCTLWYPRLWVIYYKRKIYMWDMGSIKMARQMPYSHSQNAKDQSSNTCWNKSFSWLFQKEIGRRACAFQVIGCSLANEPLERRIVFGSMSLWSHTFRFIGNFACPDMLGKFHLEEIVLIYSGTNHTVLYRSKWTFWIRLGNV